MPLTLADFETLEHARLLNIGGMGWGAPLIEGRFAGGYGGGVIGNQDYGLHRWNIRSEFLPDKDTYAAGDDDEPYFTYFFEFFKRHILLGNKPFIIVDPRDDKSYLVRFDRFDVDFGRLTSKFYTFEGITVVEARHGDLLFNEDGSLDTSGETPHLPLNTYSPLLCCGFECGIENLGGHVFKDAAGGATFTNSVGRNGGYSLKCTPGSSTIRVTINVGETTLVVGRVYLRFESFPSVRNFLIYSGLTADGIIGIAYNPSTGRLHCAHEILGSPPYDFNFFGSGHIVTLDQWYCLDFKIDRVAGTVDAQIEAVPLTQGAGDVGGNAHVLRLGSWPNSGTGVWYFDDLLVTDQAADYPLGPGSIRKFVPVADGAHNIASAGDFKDNAGNNITGAATDSYTKIDDAPLETSPGDYISQAQDTGGGPNYVEHIFGSPDAFTPTAPPRAVDAIIAYHQAVAQIGNSSFRLNDNGTEDIIKNFNDTGSTSMQYARKQFQNPPTGLGGWKLTGLSGNFNNLRHRFGYSTDGAPDQYLDGALIEAEFPEEE